ncbi:MAG TPA: pentapeptide repeat-containing protein, partial [Ktedonobacteraceae bacterium]|nr:pentapeptide repeat-containing protein [Ktedonobacteraceae bacterium]
MQKRPRLLISVGAILFVGLVVAGYLFEWDWTGFTEQNGSAKTFWDWLQLLAVLAIPASIGMGAWVFTTKLVQVREAENIDNQREEALQAYINKMLELLLVNDLRHASDDDEVRKIAQVRTATVLRKLNPARKASVLQFLQETDLMNKDKRIVELVGVDLSGARLSGANLNGANLSDANLTGANLNGISLSEANLSGTRLNGSYLNDADLRRADLSRADMNKANLGWAILSGPDRSRIFLGPSNLSGANLSEANLNGANLR